MILPSHLPQENLLLNDMKYPHIVHIEKRNDGDIASKMSSSVGTQVINLEGLLALMKSSVYIVKLEILFLILALTKISFYM